MCFDCGAPFPDHKSLKAHLRMKHGVCVSRQKSRATGVEDEQEAEPAKYRAPRRRSSRRRSRFRSGIRRLPMPVPGESSGRSRSPVETRTREESPVATESIPVGRSEPVAPSQGYVPPPLPWLAPPGQRLTSVPPAPWNLPAENWQFVQQVTEFPGGFKRWTATWTYSPANPEEQQQSTAEPELGNSPRIHFDAQQ